MRKFSIALAGLRPRRCRRGIMTERSLPAVLPWWPIVMDSLFATVWALIVILGVSAVLMALIIGGFVVILLVVMDAALLGSILLRAFLLVLLPALALLLCRQPRLSRWVLVLAGPAAGGWWGAAAAMWWLDKSRSLDGFLIALGMIGGLTAGIVFARRASRYAEG